MLETVNLTKGTFEVKLAPQSSDDPAARHEEGAPLGRMSIDKQFHGGIEGASKGEMLTAGWPAKGSAGYVAVERVTGTLDDKRGSFALMHTGTMSKGAQQLTIIVVPDSGTGELTGLDGKFTIKIADGKHFYEFEYVLAKSN